SSASARVRISKASRQRDCCARSCVPHTSSVVCLTACGVGTLKTLPKATIRSASRLVSSACRPTGQANAPAAINAAARRPILMTLPLGRVQRRALLAQDHSIALLNLVAVRLAVPHPFRVPASPMTSPRENLGLLLGFAGVVLFGGTLPATRIAVAG